MPMRVNKIAKLLLSGVFVIVLIWMSIIAGNFLGEKEGEIWAPDGLRVNLLDEPYGINSHNPSFSWHVGGDGVDQKAYQILISKTFHDMENENYIIDTGWQESSNNTYVKIHCNERIFEENTVFWWKVRVADTEDNISSYSKIKSFSMGIGKEWESLNGIWNEERSDYCFFRTKFELDERKIEKAILSATALSPEETRQYVYNMYLNGRYVGSGPARLKGKKISYNTYDITELLEKKNVLGAICYSNTEQTFLCQLTCFYADGSKEVVVNSGRDMDRWKVLNGEEAYGENHNMISTAYYIANAENINGTKYPNGWLEEAYNDDGWDSPVITRTFLNDKLYSYETENMEKYYISPKKVEYKGSGRYFVDFGKEIVGGVQINVSTQSDIPIEAIMRFGEELNKDGSVKYQMRTANVYEEIWTLDKGMQQYENIGMKTFRYLDVYIEKIWLSKENIKGIVLRQPFDDSRAYFKSTSSLLNGIYDLCKYTVKATNQNLYVDSQSRERDAYEGDVWINMMASYAVQDNYTLARVSNEYLVEKRTWPAEYPMYAVMCAWQDYVYTGNKDSLIGIYGQLKKYMDSLVIDRNCGLIENDYGEDGFNRPLVDWPETERDDYRYEEAKYNTVVNAIASCAYRDFARVAEVLGKDSDAERYFSLSSYIKESMIKNLYNENIGAFSDGLTEGYNQIDHYAQHATAYALYAEIFSDMQMRDKLIEYLEQSGRIKMSVFSAYFLLQGLYNADEGTYATKLLTANDNMRTWGYMLEEGATITTEAWSTEVKDNMTFSHPWGASPAALISQGIFGIIPVKPGFDEFRIKLQPGSIKEASIKVPTVKGEIECTYSMDRDFIFRHIKVVVPSNAKALLQLPSENMRRNKVIINGDLEVIKENNGYMSVFLKAGTYVIEV